MKWLMDKNLKKAAFIVHDLSDFGVDELLVDENKIQKGKTC